MFILGLVNDPTLEDQSKGENKSTNIDMFEFNNIVPLATKKNLY